MLIKALILDNNWWKKNFGHLFEDTKSILKVSLRQSDALSKDQLETYLKVSGTVKETVLDQDLFRYMTTSKNFSFINLIKPLYPFSA